MKKKPTEQSTNLMQNELCQSLFVPQFKRKTAAPKRTMLLTVKPALFYIASDGRKSICSPWLLRTGTFSRLQERPITNSRPGCGHRGVASMRGSYIEKGGWSAQKYSYIFIPFLPKERKSYRFVKD